jgi:hypothetical protein
MIRTIALTLVAAFAVTASAQAETIRVSVVGKSDAQISSEIYSAIRSVCLRDTRNETFVLAAYSRCLQDAKKSANQQLSAIQAQNAKLASR